MPSEPKSIRFLGKRLMHDPDLSLGTVTCWVFDGAHETIRVRRIGADRPTWGASYEFVEVRIHELGATLSRVETAVRRRLRAISRGAAKRAEVPRG